MLLLPLLEQQALGVQHIPDNVQLFHFRLVGDEERVGLVEDGFGLRGEGFVLVDFLLAGKGLLNRFPTANDLLDVVDIVSLLNPLLPPDIDSLLLPGVLRLPAWGTHSLAFLLLLVFYLISLVFDQDRLCLHQLPLVPPLSDKIRPLIGVAGFYQVLQKRDGVLPGPETPEFRFFVRGLGSDPLHELGVALGGLAGCGKRDLALLLSMKPGLDFHLLLPLLLPLFLLGDQPPAAFLNREHLDVLPVGSILYRDEGVEFLLVLHNEVNDILLDFLLDCDRILVPDFPPLDHLLREHPFRLPKHHGLHPTHRGPIA